MDRKIKTKEEIRRYDIFKGTVAVIIAILMLISGNISPSDLTGAAGTPTAENAAGEGEVAEVPAQSEATAPELVEPPPGSEVEAGMVSLSGLGMPGSRIAAYSGGAELGQTDANDAGNWQLDVELTPEVSQIVLQTLGDNGEVVAESAPIPLTVTSAGEPLTANPLEEGSRSRGGRDFGPHALS